MSLNINGELTESPRVVTARRTRVARKWPKVLDSPGDMDWISIENLHVDEDYQRRIDMRRAEKIASQFRWSDIKVLTVAIRDEMFFIIDGQHLWAAARLRGDIKKLPVYLVEENSTQRDEAGVFYRLNSNRKPVTPVERFRAELVNENRYARELTERVHACGYGLVGIDPDYEKNQSCAITSIPAIKRLGAYNGVPVLESTLKLIRNVFAGAPEMLTSHHLLGTGIYRHRLYQRAPELDDDEIAKLLSKGGLKGFNALLDRIEGHAPNRMSRQGRCTAALAKLHDKHTNGVKVWEFFIDED